MIRDAHVRDFPAILTLNKDWEHLLSPLSHARLQHLDSEAAYHRVAEDETGIAGFVLALREGTAYDSENYRWFAERYDEFLYVDRIVVTESRRRTGVGRALYSDLFAFARTCGVQYVTCEVNVEPPNDDSSAFHAAFGFREVGTQWAANRTKRVAMLEAQTRSFR
jgi:uncharacterized protein